MVMQDSTVYSPKGEKQLLEEIRKSIESTQERLHLASDVRAADELRAIAEILKDIRDESKETSKHLRLALLLLLVIVVALIVYALM
jgi:uncharacterized membrane protein (DUF106 family)